MRSRESREATARTARHLLLPPLWAVMALHAAGVARGATSADTVTALLRDLANPRNEYAGAAASALAHYPQHRARIVPALIERLRNGAWERCSGDARDAIAWTLGRLEAKEAVVPLLELAASGRSIDHECAE